eukprot:m.199862 g.199862  ORF g.199862 m.199862 type:complete len:467 (+) comp20868_c0_seq1:94-1494(+)
MWRRVLPSPACRPWCCPASRTWAVPHHWMHTDRRDTNGKQSDPDVRRAKGLEQAGAYETPDVELEQAASEIVLVSRPQPGSAVALEHFREQALDLRRSVGARTVPTGHVLVKTMWLSVDPFMRCRFNADTGVDYTAPYQLEQPLTSAGIGYVQVCGPDVDGLSPGDLVIDPFDSWPWQSDAVLAASQVTRVTPTLETLIPVTQLLGNVGLSGLTALHGVRDAACITADDTVVVSGAAGSVGLLVCQLALQRGATVIGICGTHTKSQFLTETIGVHGAVIYKDKTEDELGHHLREALHAATHTDRATVYFDNVGGTVSESVISRLARGARIVVCGQISMYNTDQEYPPPVSAAAQRTLDDRDISRTRFLVLDYADQFPSSLAELCRLTATGALSCHVTVSEGLSQAPAAFTGMMSGTNIGKALVRCADAPPLVRVYEGLRNALPAWVKGKLCDHFASPAVFTPKLPS